MDIQMERVHWTLEQTLQCVLSDQWLAESEWTDVVGVAELSINTTVTSATGEVPLKLDLGEVPHMSTDAVVDRQATAAQPAAKAFSTSVHEIVEATQKCLQLVQARMAAQASKHCCDVLFVI